MGSDYFLISIMVTDAISVINLSGFTFQNYITTKQSFKDDLKSIGIGFDGDVNLPICFQATFTQPQITGDIKLRTEGLFPEIMVVESNFSEISYFTKTEITEWFVNSEDPLAVESFYGPTTYPANCPTGVYDPLLSCTADSAHSDLCSSLNLAERGTPIGSLYDVSLSSTQDEAPVFLQDYHFTSTPNTWSAIRISNGTDVACAKLLPINCVSEELEPINPYLQEKLLTLAALKSQVLAEGWGLKSLAKQALSYIS